MEASVYEERDIASLTLEEHREPRREQEIQL